MIPQTRTVIYMAILNEFIIYCYLIGRVDTYTIVAQGEDSNSCTFLCIYIR
jgi:hypothetical protein